jgi:hypothetical protein
MNAIWRLHELGSWTSPVQLPESDVLLNWNFPAMIGPENRKQVTHHLNPHESNALPKNGANAPLQNINA